MLEYSEYLLHSLLSQALCDFVYASARALFSQGGQDFGETLSRPAPYCPTQLICTWIFICSMTKLKEHSREIC